jgi:hypothetical protein
MSTQKYNFSLRVVAIFSEKEECMRKTLVILCVLVGAAVAIASTPKSTNRSTNSSPAVKTYLLPDLTLKSVISPALLPAPATSTQAVTAVAQKRPKTGFCRCSCGFPCSTDADCGGASCDPFITCCDKAPGSKDNAWFYQGFLNASHKGALPEEVLKPMCK